MTVAGQPIVNYTYDANSRLTQLTQGTQKTFDFNYDALGRRTSLILPNGIIATYNYDNASRLTNITYSLNSQILKSLNYAYDMNGNRVLFNGHNTLLPEQMAATYNDANQMITHNTANLSFDTNGNLISKGDTTYQWDARNRLIRITSPTYNASFKYDAFGRRIEKAINEKTTNYLYDRWDIVQEIEDGTVSTNYLRSLYIDETLGILRPENTYYYLHDALGSTIALTDPLGNIATEYYYDPFGKTQASNPNIYNPFQYTGRENDGNGLYGYRARTFSTELHRFISQDPLRLLGGVNFYSYAGNQPTRYRDPFGLWYFDINVSGGYWVGVTAGVMIGPSGVYVYGGGGGVTPGGGGSITWSPSDPTPGWTVGLQGQYGIAGQVGYSFGEGGGKFWEIGGGWPPGGSLTGYYVFDPIKKVPPIKPAKCQ